MGKKKATTSHGLQETKEQLNVDSDSNTEEERPPVDYSNPIVSNQANLALLWLLFYSILMFTLPFGAFYCVRYVLEKYFDITGFDNTAFSVLVAVIIINVIIGVYAYQAYHEPEYDNQGNEIDQKAPIKPKKMKTKAKKDL